MGVFSGNSLGKADRASLDGLGIRFVQKDRSACSKIMNMLSSPDLRKCSSCTRWKPITEFSGKATCDACRPKKRKQGASAVIHKRAALDLLQHENEWLRAVVLKQNSEISSLRSEVSWQAGNILRQHSLPPSQQAQPRPAVDLSTGNDVQRHASLPTMQQENIQRPYPFPVPQQQQQPPADAKPEPGMNALPCDQALHSLAFECFQEEMQRQQQQQSPHQQDEMQRQAQTLYSQNQPH